MIKIVIDTQTNEITEIPYSDSEKKQAQKEREAIDAEIAAFTLEEEKKSKEKQAILNRLGLTEDEAKLLLS